jgi:hypothetical protein
VAARSVAQPKRTILEFDRRPLHIGRSLRSRRSVVHALLVGPRTVKHEGELARFLDVAPPQAYERGADGKRSWWRRAVELLGTFRRRHGDALTPEDVAEYRKQKAPAIFSLLR